MSDDDSDKKNTQEPPYLEIGDEPPYQRDNGDDVIDPFADSKKIIHLKPRPSKPPPSTPPREPLKAQIQRSLERTHPLVFFALFCFILVMLLLLPQFLLLLVKIIYELVLILRLILIPLLAIGGTILVLHWAYYGRR